MRENVRTPITHLKPAHVDPCHTCAKAPPLPMQLCNMAATRRASAAPTSARVCRNNRLCVGKPWRRDARLAMATSAAVVSGCSRPQQLHTMLTHTHTHTHTRAWEIHRIPPSESNHIPCSYCSGLASCSTFMQQVYIQRTQTRFDLWPSPVLPNG